MDGKREREGKEGFKEKERQMGRVGGYLLQQSRVRADEECRWRRDLIACGPSPFNYPIQLPSQSATVKDIARLIVGHRSLDDRASEERRKIKMFGSNSRHFFLTITTFFLTTSRSV